MSMGYHSSRAEKRGAEAADVFTRGKAEEERQWRLCREGASVIL